MEAEQLTAFQTQVYQIYEAYGFYFLVLILAIGAWEIASRIYRRKLSFGNYVLDSISSIATLPLIGVMAYLAALIGIGSIYSVGNVIYEQYAIYQAGWSIGSVLLVLLATDFQYYWEHRGFHRINVMWATHTVPSQLGFHQHPHGLPVRSAGQFLHRPDSLAADSVLRSGPGSDRHCRQPDLPGVGYIPKRSGRCPPGSNSCSTRHPITGCIMAATSNTSTRITVAA